MSPEGPVLCDPAGILAEGWGPGQEEHQEAALRAYYHLAPALRPLPLIERSASLAWLAELCAGLARLVGPGLWARISAGEMCPPPLAPSVVLRDLGGLARSLSGDALELEHRRRRDALRARAVWAGKVRFAVFDCVRVHLGYSATSEILRCEPRLGVRRWRTRHDEAFHWSAYYLYRAGLTLSEVQCAIGARGRHAHLLASRTLARMHERLAGFAHVRESMEPCRAAIIARGVALPPHPTRYGDTLEIPEAVKPTPPLRVPGERGRP